MPKKRGILSVRGYTWNVSGHQDKNVFSKDLKEYTSNQHGYTEGCSRKLSDKFKGRKGLGTFEEHQ